MIRCQNQKEVARRYRAMVLAVRAWVQLAHPYADRLTLLDEHDIGTSKQLAAFHADLNDWSEGDRLAMPPRRN